MQFEFLFQSNAKPDAPGAELLELGSLRVPVDFVRHRRARRYILRLQPDGRVRVTIPNRGSKKFAREFALKHGPWIEQQFRKLEQHRQVDRRWRAGMRLYLRGELHRLELNEHPSFLEVGLGTERFRLKRHPGDLRPAVEVFLRHLAHRDVPPRVEELARLHQFKISRISIRDQKSRWGSCSHLGTISLNWRLIQMPPFVSDYIILHELAHLRHLNHSRRYWREVQRICPEYERAEQWLKDHSDTLRNGILPGDE